MSATTAGRRRGGIPRSVDYVRRCLLIRAKARWPEKGPALLQVADLICVIAKQAEKGDPDSGYFLGELLPALRKSQPTLSKVNPAFERRCKEMDSAPFPTAKDAPFRAIVEEIIREAQAQKHKHEILQLIPEAAAVLGLNKTLIALPDLRSADDVVDIWVDKVVYPTLRKRQRELRAIFDAGRLKKARDQNGKFQVSRLKPLTRDTVARIAKVPRVYFFNIG